MTTSTRAKIGHDHRSEDGEEEGRQRREAEPGGDLDAGVQLTASDGESRRIKAGDVVLVEDTWGKGHLSKAIDGKLRHCIFVPID